MTDNDKKIKYRFIIVLLMGLFVTVVCIWSLTLLIENVNNNQTLIMENNSSNNTNKKDEIIDGGISEQSKIDIKAAADYIISKVKFETKLKVIDNSIANSMINVSKNSELNLYMGSGSFSDVLILIKASDTATAKSDQKAIEQYLKDVRNSFEAYIPEQAKKISDAIIVRSSCYVIACVTSDKENAKNIILSVFKQN